MTTASAPSTPTPTAISSSSSTMQDLDAEEKHMESTLHTLQSQLHTLSHSIQLLPPLLLQSSNTAANNHQHDYDNTSISSYDLSQVYACLAYTLASLEHIYLRTINDQDTMNNKKDLERIKKYIEKINEMEKRNESVTVSVNENDRNKAISITTTSRQQRQGRGREDKGSDIDRTRKRKSDKHDRRRSHNDKRRYDDTRQRHEAHQHHRENKHVKL